MTKIQSFIWRRGKLASTTVLIKVDEVWNYFFLEIHSRRGVTGLRLIIRIHKSTSRHNVFYVLRSWTDRQTDRQTGIMHTASESTEEDSPFFFSFPPSLLAVFCTNRAPPTFLFSPRTKEETGLKLQERFRELTIPAKMQRRL